VEVTGGKAILRGVYGVENHSRVREGTHIVSGRGARNEPFQEMAPAQAIRE